MRIKISTRSWLDVVTVVCLAPPITIAMLGLAGIAVALLVVALPFVAIGLIIYSIIS